MAIHYRQILELHAQELVQRDIAAITGNSRPKISEVIKQAELHQISPPFTDDVDDIWLESLLFPQKQPMAKGRQIPDFEKIHEELAKPNVTLSLVHYEYEQECRQNGTIPYAYRTFCQYYRAYAQKYKATMRIRRNPGEVMRSIGLAHLCISLIAKLEKSSRHICSSLLCRVVRTATVRHL